MPRRTDHTRLSRQGSLQVFLVSRSDVVYSGETDTQRNTAGRDGMLATGTEEIYAPLMACVNLVPEWINAW
jgi:hypothetical protein